MTGQADAEAPGGGGDALPVVAPPPPPAPAPPPAPPAAAAPISVPHRVLSASRGLRSFRIPGLLRTMSASPAYVAAAKFSSPFAKGGPERAISDATMLTMSENWSDYQTATYLARTATNATSLGNPHQGRSGWLAGVGHIICANIGAGVLTLPNAVAWLGWVAGPIMIVLLTAVAGFCSELLTYAHRGKGEAQPTYKDAVYTHLGRRRAGIIVAVLYLRYFLVAIGYTVIASTGMRYIARWGCRARGVAEGECRDDLWMMTLIFSGMQLFLSQLPNLEAAAGASAVGAVMSLLYSGIALVLGLANVSNGRGSALGRPAPPLEKAFGVFNALGSILFSNASAVLTIDVQHTMREPPASRVTMRKVIRTAFGVAMGLYLTVGTAGYVAIGDSVGADILVEFESSRTLPPAVPVVANIFTVIHFVLAYQVYAQPLFVVLEQGLLQCCPRLMVMPEWSTRLAYRTVFVMVTCAMATTLPFFGAISGLIGAIAFWPTVVAGPILMYLKIRRPPRRARALLLALLGAMGVVCFCALVGSVYSFVHASQKFKLFGTK